MWAPIKVLYVCHPLPGSQSILDMRKLSKMKWLVQSTPVASGVWTQFDFKVHVALTVNSDIPVPSTRSPPWAWAVYRQKTHPSEISPLIDGNKLCFVLISLLYIEPKFASGQISSHWTTQSKFLALLFHRPSNPCQQLSEEMTNTEPASMWLIC